MSETTIDRRHFTNAAELAGSIAVMISDHGLRREIVNVISGPIYHTGRVLLIEETLTDGSKVYYVQIRRD